MKIKNVLPRISLLVMSLVLWSCSDLGEPTTPLTGPGEAAQTDGLLTSPKYTVAKGVLDVKVKENSRIIQPSAGGDVGVEGNVLIVPAGAVLEPTLFVMRFAATDGGTTKAVFELRAFQKDAKGDYTVDVGAKGFLLPLRLKLRYDWLTDPVPAENFRIVWLKADGGQEIYLTEQHKGSQTLNTYLTHFSDYAIGFPN